MWNSAEFFRAKLDEQTARHARYHDTAYNLEPNVKGSPGGLRDIQMIVWLAQRHLGRARSRISSAQVPHRRAAANPRPGSAFPVADSLRLHLLTGRREDRLLFDHQ
jgi:[protein-PII] uridylyltransferase